MNEAVPKRKGVLHVHAIVKTCLVSNAFAPSIKEDKCTKVPKWGIKVNDIVFVRRVKLVKLVLDVYI